MTARNDHTRLLIPWRSLRILNTVRIDLPVHGGSASAEQTILGNLVILCAHVRGEPPICSSSLDIYADVPLLLAGEAWAMQQLMLQRHKITAGQACVFTHFLLLKRL